MSQEKTNKLVIAIMLIFVALSVTSVVSALIQNVDVSGEPQYIIVIVEGAKYVLTSVPVAIVVAVGISMGGYVINWLGAQRQNSPTVEYSVKWLAHTVGRVEAWIVVVTPLVDAIVLNLPPEQKYIAMLVTGSLFALIDIILSEIQRTIQKVRATSAVAPAVTNG